MKTKLHRMEIGGAGMGEASEDDVARRALELARADGRTEINDIDIINAVKDLGGSAPENPEDQIDEADRDGNGFPAAGLGTQAPRVELDDEANLAEELVQEGIDEAEHESRLHSNDRDMRQ